MSTNCLVTKMKGSVDNSNLEKLGVLSFSVNIPNGGITDVQGYKEIKCSAPLTVTIPEGKHIYSSGTQLSNKETFTPGSSGFIYFNIMEEGNYKVELQEKYSITGINDLGSTNYLGTIDLMNFKYNSLDKLMSVKNIITGDLSNLLNSKETLTYLSIEYDADSMALRGTTDVIGQFTKLGTLSLLRCNSISGGLYKLGNLTSLTSLTIAGTGIEGTLEDFIRAQYSAPVNPRTIGNISCPWIGNTGVTFQGSSIAATGSSTIAWEPSSTTGKISVTISGGTPVDIDA